MKMRVEKGYFVKLSWLGIYEKFIRGKTRKLVTTLKSYYIIGEVRDGYKKKVRLGKTLTMINLEVMFSSYDFIKKGAIIDVNINKLDTDLKLDEDKVKKKLHKSHPEWRFYYTNFEILPGEKALIYEL